MKFAVLGIVFSLASGWANVQAAGDKKAHNMVVQVVDNDPIRWKQTLGIVKNLKKDMGNDNLGVEIVVHGGGLKMALLESDVAKMMADVQKDGVVFSACNASMKQQKVKENDLVDGVKVVPFGAKRIMERQEQGWTYLRM